MIVSYIIKDRQEMREKYGKRKGNSYISGGRVAYSIVRILQAKSMVAKCPGLYNLGINKPEGYTMRKLIHMVAIALGLLVDAKKTIQSSEMETIVKL